MPRFSRRGGLVALYQGRKWLKHDWEGGRERREGTVRNIIIHHDDISCCVVSFSSLAITQKTHDVIMTWLD